jgi:O-antigen ligase
VASLSSRIERAFRWCGRWYVLLAILAVQAALVLVAAWEWKVAVALVVGLAVVATVLERPVLGVALLVAARLMDTSANAFLRIGRTNIGFFEPILLLALGAVAIHVVHHKRPVTTAWPWLPPFLCFFAFACISLAWSADRGEGLSEIVTLVVILANAAVILTFVRTPKDLLFVLYAWTAASAAIGAIAIGSDVLGVSATGPWQAAAGGARETGLGQQPNWYAMTLMFIVHTTFGLALVQERRAWRWVLLATGVFIFVCQMRSGSRGGTYAILIGGLLAALAQPLFRKWFLRFAVLIVVIFAVAILADLGPTSRAFLRVWENLDHTWSNVRGMNWGICLQMFQDTSGIGIGAGGYVALLEKYSSFLYNSVYRYPHGIVWGLLAHYGVVGLLLFGWLAVTVAVMARRLVTWTRDSLLHVVAWTMPATMLGYAAWSFVEFEYNEKPFWEFLSLYTALYLIVQKAVRDGVSLPPLPGRAALPWQRTGPAS